MKRDLRAALLCALLVVLCVLATVPVLEMGVNDDWSYTRTARHLARTGRLTYNGWATVMLGVQAYWAALFITLFGFSFTLVRLTTLPLAAGCAFLLYALGRRAGLTPSLAAFGTLTVVLSPVFLPLAASFMTDVPGLFFLLLSIYGCARALDGERPLPWLALAAAAGVLGGTSRQIVWLAPLALLPYVGWSRRDEKKTAVAAAGLWLISLLLIAGCMARFRAQPYALPENLTEGFTLFLRGLPASLLALLPLVFTLVLFALPALVGTLRTWRPLADVGLVPLALALALGIALPFLVFSDLAFAPWLGNMVTRWGVLAPGETTIGAEPETLPFPVRVALSLAVYAMLAVLLLASLRALRRRGEIRENGAPPAASPWVVRLWTLFAILYLPLLIPRAVQGVAFDRYLIPLLPAVLLPLLLRYQRTVAPAPATAGWAALGLFALYGVATTHDYLAMSRARLAAATALTRAGVPRTQILAGLEYDGWTEVEASGYVNDRRIQVPPGAYREVGERTPPLSSPYAFWQWTPRIEFRYFVVLSPQRDLVSTEFGPFPYTTWLPPSRRQVLVQRVQ